MNKIIALSLLLSTCSFAGEKHQLRQWNFNQDKEAIAKFKSYSKGYVKLRTPAGKTVSLKMSQLSNEDRIYMRSITRDDRIRFDQPQIEDKDRLLIPSMNQSTFGNTDKNCGPNSVANFLLWWDQEGILPLPYKEKDLDKLADRLHRELENSMRCSNGTKPDKFVEGLKRFVARRDLGTWHNFKVDSKEATTENIVSASKGAQLSVLSVKVLKNGRMDEGHYISVTSCDGDIITFNTWGEKFTGRLKSGIISKQKVTFIELVREPGSQIFNWITEQGGGFVIEKSDQVITLNATKRETPRKK